MHHQWDEMGLVPIVLCLTWWTVIDQTQLCYYVHFWTHTLRKGMTPTLIPQISTIYSIFNHFLHTSQFLPYLLLIASLILSFFFSLPSFLLIYNLSFRKNKSYKIFLNSHVKHDTYLLIKQLLISLCVCVYIYIYIYSLRKNNETNHKGL